MTTAQGPVSRAADEVRLLDREGHLQGSPPMREEQIREAFELMVLSRSLDELAVKLQRLKRIGLYAPVEGQEAAVIGSGLAVDPAQDWMVPASREQPAMIRHGYPVENMLASYMGRLEHAGIPSDVKLLPRQQSIAAQMPQAAGLAWALKLRGDPGVVMAYCGDGGSSEGDFHEALNFAGVMGAPLVTVVINNQYAISTPYRRQTAAESLAARGPGYGMPGIAVDGNDVFAVYAASVEAVRRARSGLGPTLIECRTYRLSFHNTSDNPNDYREDAEYQDALRDEPVGRLERHILSSGLMGRDEIDDLRRRTRAELDAAQRSVAALPRPGPAYIFDHVYATLPPRVRQQRDETLEGG